MFMLLFSIDFTTHLYNNNNNNWDLNLNLLLIQTHQTASKYVILHVACIWAMDYFYAASFQSSTASTAFFQQTKERHIDLERHEGD